VTSHPGSEQILSPLTGSSCQSIGPADMLWLRSYRTHFRCFCLDRSALASPRSIRYRCIRLRKILTVESFQISISNILAPYRKASRRICNHAGFLGSYRLLRSTRGLPDTRNNAGFTIVLPELIHSSPRYALDLGNYPRGFLPLFLVDYPTDLLPGNLHR
jgi:hypothetical protein